MTCDRFSAADALRWGFVNHVVPDDDLLPRARALAEKLLAKDPISLALTKSATNALAESMVPCTRDLFRTREHLILTRLLADERRRSE